MYKSAQCNGVLPVAKTETKPLPVNVEPKYDEKGLIQFLSNVHFPESASQSSCMQNSQNCTLSDYINLLPPDMTLADMIMQPINFQERWFHHLLETKGLEAAKKFEYLIHTTTKKESLLPAQKSSVVSSTSSGISSPCKLYMQRQLPDLNWYNKPVNQINLDQPVYLLDQVTSPMKCGSQKNGVGPLRDNLLNGTSNSIPLYKRQSLRDQQLCMISKGQDDISERNNDKTNSWRNEINAQFSSMSLGDTNNRVMPNGVTYASILRSQQQDQSKMSTLVTSSANTVPLNLLNNIRHDSINLNEPRLYQYFS